MNLKIEKSHIILLLIIFIGIGARLIQYLYNRSFWYDEAKVAYHILTHSFNELHLTFLTATTAPILFLYLVKLNTFFFGYNEYSLRLLPLLCVILSIVLYYFISNKIFPRPYNIFSVVFISFAWPLIYYSIECKQYAIDVFIVLSLLLFFIYLNNQPGVLIRDLFIFGILGLVSILSSYPSIFLVVATICIFVYRFGLKFKFIHLLTVSLIGLIWGLTFYFQYMLTLNKYLNIAWFQEFWSEGYLQPDFSPAAFKHNIDIIFNLLIFAGFPDSILILVLCIILIVLGLIDLLKRHRPFALVLILTIFFLVLASFFMRYPIVDRMALFILPLLFLLITAGILRLSLYSKRAGQCLLIMIMLIFLAVNLPKQWPPFEKENFKLAMLLIRNNAEPQDGLYMNFRAILPFVCHRSIRPYKYPDTIWGKMPFSGLSDDELDMLAKSEIVKMMSYRRVWLLFNNINSRNWILRYMPGKYISHYSFEGINLYLFKMSNYKEMPATSGNK